MRVLAGFRLFGLLVGLGIVCDLVAARGDTPGKAAKSTGGARSAVAEVVAANVGGEPIYVRQVEKLLAVATHGHPPVGLAGARMRAAILGELVERQIVLRSLEQKHAAASDDDVASELKRMKADWDHGEALGTISSLGLAKARTTLEAESALEPDLGALR